MYWRHFTTVKSEIHITSFIGKGTPKLKPQIGFYGRSHASEKVAPPLPSDDQDCERRGSCFLKAHCALRQEGTDTKSNVELRWRAFARQNFIPPKK